MANEVIKEFLIAVGFKTDERSAKRTTELIAGVEKQLVANDKAARERDAAEKARVAAQTLRASETAAALRMVGGAVAAFATVAATAMGAVALAIKNGIGEFDKLYYVAGRTGASVNNLKALGYAFKQTGSSAEAAMGAVENFARARRANPGIDAMLRGYGINTKGDTSDVLMNSIEAIRQRHPQFAGAQVAEMLGISPDEYDHLIRYRTEIARFSDEYKKLQSAMGVNGGETATAAKEIMRQFGRLTAVVEVFADKLTQMVAPAIEFVATKLGSLVEFLTDDEKKKALAQYFDPIIGATKTLVQWVQNLYDLFVKLFDYVRASPLGKMLGAINPGFVREGILNFLQPSSAEAATNPEGDTTASAAKPGLFRRGLNAIKRGLGIGASAVDKTPLGPVPAGLLDNIARAEGTYRTGYNTSLGHGRFLPGGKEQDLTSMTLKQILQLGRYMRSQPGNPNSSALGRYQIVGSTLKDAAKALDMDLDTQKFDVETQDRMAHWIARRQGIGAWEGFKTHPAERAAAAAALARKDQSAGTRQAAPIIIAPKPQAGRATKSPGSFSVDDYLRAAPMGSTNNSTDNSRSIKQDNNVSVTIQGGSGDAQATGASVRRALGDVHAMSLRNVSTAIR